MEMVLDWDTYEKSVNENLPLFIKKSIDFLKNVKTNSRLIKTHLPWDLLPNAIKSKEKRPKVF